jgi:transposase
MDAILEKCAGLDVHKKEVVACALTGPTDARPKKEVRRFSTMTYGLEEMRDWLVSLGVTHVAMESTGPYWKPVFNVLEDHVTVLLANARHIKNVPGRKTDVRDCEWIAQLVRCGLVDGSFVPPRHIREARDLTRYRRSLVEEGAREKNRVQKILEDANIKIGSVLSDVFGASGQKMLEKLVEGEGTPEEIAALAKGRLRPKIPELTQALNGVVGEHHRFLIKQMLDHMEYIERQVMEVDTHIVAHFAPELEELELLDGIPGVGASAAAAIIAEVGTDMNQFPSEGHIASWAGLCPGNNESAGKKSPESADTGTGGSARS